MKDINLNRWAKLAGINEEYNPNIKQRLEIGDVITIFGEEFKITDFDKPEDEQYVDVLKEPNTIFAAVSLEDNMPREFEVNDYIKSASK